MSNIKINFVGGSPTASHFFLLRQRKSNQKEGDPGLPPLRGTLRCSTGQAAAALALRTQTVLSDIPCPASATRRRTGEEKQKPRNLKFVWRAQCAHHRRNSKTYFR